MTTPYTTSRNVASGSSIPRRFRPQEGRTLQSNQGLSSHLDNIIADKVSSRTSNQDENKALATVRRWWSSSHDVRKKRAISLVHVILIAWAFIVTAWLISSSLRYMGERYARDAKVVVVEKGMISKDDAGEDGQRNEDDTVKQDDMREYIIQSDGISECARDGSRAQSFLLLFMGHSGSTAIMTALQQHSQTFITGLEPVDHGDMAKDTQRALKYADNFFANATAHGLTAGFKIRPQHLLRAPKSWAALMRKHRTRIIWNFRTNIFKQAIGHYPITYLGSKAAYEGLKVESHMDLNSSAMNTSSISIRTNDGKKDLEKDGSVLLKAGEEGIHRFRIDHMDGLAKIIQDREHGEKQVEQAIRKLEQANWYGHDCILPVSYESFHANAVMTIIRIQVFLGLDVGQVHLPMRAKATDDNLCELLENYEEVCNAFYGCSRMRWMLDDYANGCMCSRLVTGSGFTSQSLCPS